ncbi:unnamed protein product [Symbiodinium microadriaticum]|nr:unnamed protein product [Symbiodinium microadriaticum]
MLLLANCSSRKLTASRSLGSGPVLTRPSADDLREIRGEIVTVFSKSFAAGFAAVCLYEALGWQLHPDFACDLGTLRVLWKACVLSPRWLDYVPLSEAKFVWQQMLPEAPALLSKLRWSMQPDGSELTRRDTAGRLRVLRPGLDGFSVVFKWLRQLYRQNLVACAGRVKRSYHRHAAGLATGLDLPKPDFSLDYHFDGLHEALTLGLRGTDLAALGAGNSCWFYNAGGGYEEHHSRWQCLCGLSHPSRVHLLWACDKTAHLRTGLRDPRDRCEERLLLHGVPEQPPAPAALDPGGFFEDLVEEIRVQLELNPAVLFLATDGSEHFETLTSDQTAYKQELLGFCMAAKALGAAAYATGWSGRAVFVLDCQSALQVVLQEGLRFNYLLKLVEQVRLPLRDLASAGVQLQYVWVPSHGKKPSWCAPPGLCSDLLRYLNDLVDKAAADCRQRRGGQGGRVEWWQRRSAASKWDLGAILASAAAGQLLRAKLQTAEDPAATADTLRKLRKLVIFSGEDLTENFPLYFNSVSLLEELEARVEDARLYMQGQERTAKTSGERQWLARGVSPERALEMRAARATTWAEFSQEEVDAMTPSKRHAMTTRFATQAAAAAKAKATAEAEEINVDHSIRPFVHEKWVGYGRRFWLPLRMGGILVDLPLGSWSYGGKLGASGRIILAGSHVTRADLDMNWEVIGHTVKALGSRPCVDHLEEVVADFFGKTRKFCRVQAWRIRNLVTMLVRIIKLPHRPSEEGIRNIYKMLDIPIPPGRSSDSLGSRCNAGDDAEDEVLLAEEAGESEMATDDEIDEALLCPEAPSEGAGAVEHSPCLVETPSPRVPPSQSPASEAKNSPPQSKQQILQHLEQCQKTLQALLEAKQQRQAGKQELQMLSRNVETQDTLPMEPAAIEEAVEVAKEQMLKAERLQLRSASDRKRKDLDGSCAWMRKGGESDVDKTGMGGCATGVAVSEQPAHDASHKHAETHPIKAIKKEPPSVPIKREPQESQEAPPKEKELPAMPIKREPQESQVVPRNEKELPAMPIKKEPQEEPMKPEHKEKKMHDDADASMDPKQVKPAALTPEPNAGNQAALVPSDPPPAKPSLLQNALVLSPAEQKKMANATAKSKYAPGSKKKKADADEDAEEEQEKKVQVKRKPGRPKGKAAPKTPSSPKAKASPKKAAASRGSEADTAAPKAKAKCKAAAKAKAKCKAAAKAKAKCKAAAKAKAKCKAAAKVKAKAKAKCSAGDKKDDDDPSPSQRTQFYECDNDKPKRRTKQVESEAERERKAKKSRKSCAYHRVKLEKLSEGYDEEEANMFAREVFMKIDAIYVCGPLAVQVQARVAVGQTSDLQAGQWRGPDVLLKPVLVAIVLLLGWSSQLPSCKKFDLLDLFAGRYIHNKTGLKCYNGNSTYPMGFVQKIYNIFVGQASFPKCLRNKEVVNNLLSDQEIFARMPLGDCWEDASVASVYFYLRNGKHLVIPDTWMNTIEAFDAALNERVNCFQDLRDEYNSLCEQK